MGVFDKLLGKKPRVTSEEVAGTMARMVIEQAMAHLDKAVEYANAATEDDVLRLCNELVALYVFVADSSLFNIYRQGPDRERIMQHFWRLYEQQRAARPDLRTQIPPSELINQRLTTYGNRYASPGNPLEGIAIDFGTCCGQPGNLRLGLLAAQGFHDFSGQFQELLKQVDVRDQ